MTMTLPEQRVDLIFPVRGLKIPRDHGYVLYGATAHVIDDLHRDMSIGIFPIAGAPGANETLLLTRRSALRFRLPAARLPMLLPLAGKTLMLDDQLIRIGVPHVAAIESAPVLASALVLIKLAHPSAKHTVGIVPPDAFLAAARKKLHEMNIRGEPRIQIIRAGPRAGQDRRRVMRVKNQTHVGYAMVVQGLTAEESIRLQENGIGGRRLMGCGLFMPAEPYRSSK